MSNVDDLVKNDPCTFCLNDYQNLTDEVNKKHISILHKMFSKKSLFEK